MRIDYGSLVIVKYRTSSRTETQPNICVERTYA